MDNDRRIRRSCSCYGQAWKRNCGQFEFFTRQMETAANKCALSEILLRLFINQTILAGRVPSLYTISVSIIGPRSTLLRSSRKSLFFWTGLHASSVFNGQSKRDIFSSTAGLARRRRFLFLQLKELSRKRAIEQTLWSWALS